MEASEKLITDHLNLWTSTVQNKKSAGRGGPKKRALYGTKKLRELILELAVMGKLVPQEPKEEVATTITNSKKHSSGKKKPKWAVTIEEEEKPFTIPNNWKWFRLGDVTTLKHGYAFSSEFFTSESSPYILTTPGNFYERGGFRDLKSKRKYYDGPITSEFIFEPGDLIIPMTEQAAGLLGSPAFIPDNGKIYLHNQRLGKIRVEPNVLFYEYIFWFFNCSYFRGELARTCTGMKVRHTSPDRVLRSIIPLPPLAEQHRIVAKVDELMALCDQLEQEQESSLDTHDTLVATLLGALTTATADAGQFAEAWQRIQANFDTLFTTESSIDQLKQTILQLAVMGKLVPQDPNDEPASAVLKKIEAEKAKLIKERVYQKASKLKTPEAQKLYPSSWASTQVGAICPSIVPNRDKPKSFNGTEIPWVTLPDFPTNNLYLENLRVQKSLSAQEADDYSARIIPSDSVLMSCVGRFGLTAINRVPVSSNQQVHGFVVLDGLKPEYLSYSLRASSKDMERAATSTTIAYLNKTNCESISLGLPPLAEQHRIVAKVNELMELCDQLKASLATAQATQLNLADTLVEQAID